MLQEGKGLPPASLEESRGGGGKSGGLSEGWHLPSVPTLRESVGKAEGKVLQMWGRGWGGRRRSSEYVQYGRWPAHTGCGALWALSASGPLLYIKSSPVKDYTEKSEYPISVFKPKFGL